jgi:hypothetical protein
VTEDLGASSILVSNGRVSRTRRISDERPRPVSRLEHKQDADAHEVGGDDVVEKPRHDEDEDADADRDDAGDQPPPLLTGVGE